jgi:hypothetical protein
VTVGGRVTKLFPRYRTNRRTGSSWDSGDDCVDIAPTTGNDTRIEFDGFEITFHDFIFPDLNFIDDILNCGGVAKINITADGFSEIKIFHRTKNRDVLSQSLHGDLIRDMRLNCDLSIWDKTNLDNGG